MRLLIYERELTYSPNKVYIIFELGNRSLVLVHGQLGLFFHLSDISLELRIQECRRKDKPNSPHRLNVRVLGHRP